MQVTSRIGNNCTSDAHSWSSDEGYSCSSASGHEELDFEDYSPVENTQNEALWKTKSKNDACPIEEGEIVVDDETTVDIEDGEIPDPSNTQPLNTLACRFYRKGKCVYGRNCRFFHMSDKGLYSMFESPVVVHYRENFAHDVQCFLPPSPFEETETTWDRALKEAMDRVKESKKRVALDKLYMTIQRDECVNKRTRPEAPRKSRISQPSVRKVRIFSRSKNDSRHAVAAAKPKSPGRYSKSRETYCLKWRDPWRRSKTPPKRKRWSPKSVSDCSCSRSRSRSSRDKSSCRLCRTQSLKRSRRSYSNKRRSRSTSSSTSSSVSSVSKKVSRRSSDRKKRKSRSRFTRSKIAKSYCSSPKTKFTRKPNRKSSPDAKKDVRPCPVSPKHPAVQKASLFSQSGNRSCSDMSISSLSDSSSNRKISQSEDRPTFCHSSDRRVSDMSISPLSGASDPDEFSHKTERTASEVSKPSVENLNSHVAPKVKSDGQEFTESGRAENIYKGQFPRANSNVSNSNIRTQEKKRKSDPLLMELMKYHGNFRRSDATVDSKARTVTAASKDADSHLQHERSVIKEKRKSGVNQNRLSKKEMLLKRLQEIDAAIKRKKTCAQFSASKNP